MGQEEGDFVRQAIKGGKIRGPGDSPIGPVSQSELAPQPRSHPDAWLLSHHSALRRRVIREDPKKRIPSCTEVLIRAIPANTKSHLNAQ